MDRCARAVGVANNSGMSVRSAEATDGWRATIGRISMKRYLAKSVGRLAVGSCVAGTVMRQANIRNRNCVMVARGKVLMKKRNLAGIARQALLSFPGAALGATGWI